MVPPNQRTAEEAFSRGLCRFADGVLAHARTLGTSEGTLSGAAATAMIGATTLPRPTI
jgi:hypothetical protein